MSVMQNIFVYLCIIYFLYQHGLGEIQIVDKFIINLLKNNVSLVDGTRT